MKNIIFIILILFLGASSNDVHADTWNLPCELNDENTKITFEVDSTWHIIHGKTAGVSGRVWLNDNKDFSSVKAEIQLPVSSFDTDSKSRDSELRNVMAAYDFPQVKFTLDKIDSLKSPDVMKEGDTQAVTLKGKLTIRSTTLPVEVQGLVNYVGSNYSVNGQFPIMWADFGVEDPSILIAKLDPIANVSFLINLTKKG